MKAELSDVGAVALQLLVHLAQHDSPERLVDEEGGRDGQSHQHQEGDACAANPGTTMPDVCEMPWDSCRITGVQGTCLRDWPAQPTELPSLEALRNDRRSRWRHVDGVRCQGIAWHSARTRGSRMRAVGSSRDGKPGGPATDFPSRRGRSRPSAAPIPEPLKRPPRDTKPERETWTLAVDIGGTGIKASVLDERGALLAAKVRVETPVGEPPGRLLRALGASRGPCRASTACPSAFRALSPTGAS